MTGKFRRVDDRFWVSPQIRAEDLAAAHELGVAVVVNNRPDGEAPDQPSGATIQAAAETLGLGYVAAPVQGGPSEAAVAAMTDALNRGPVLAYCYSGTRSMLIWALSQLISGAREREDVLALARNAGYDLSRWI